MMSRYLGLTASQLHKYHHWFIKSSKNCPKLCFIIIQIFFLLKSCTETNGSQPLAVQPWGTWPMLICHNVQRWNPRHIYIFIILLRYNSHTTQFTLLENIMQCLLVYSRSVHTWPLSNFRIFSSFQKETLYSLTVSSHPLLPQTPGKK